MCKVGWEFNSIFNKKMQKYCQEKLHTAKYQRVLQIQKKFPKVTVHNHQKSLSYTPGGFVWCDGPLYQYLVKQPQEKWACDFHDDAPPLSFQLQVAEVIF